MLKHIAMLMFILLITATLATTPVAAIIDINAPVSSNEEWSPIERVFDGVTMVLVPAGCFEMGAENNQAEERPIHEQCIEKTFWIDKYEVSNELYGSVAEGCEQFSSEPNQPRTCVSWFDARDFCAGRDARLPSEVEWEYAARGPDSLLYPWGDEFDGTLANHCDSNCAAQDWSGNIVQTNTENDDGFAVTAPVGSYPAGASWVGALDMSGNVWEWTYSIFEPYPYDATDGRESGDISESVAMSVRGGSYSSGSDYGTTARRARPIARAQSDHFGFRCARDFTSN